MFKSLWNYLRGYVIIEISGFSIERFLNLCINQEIIVFDLKESKKGIICKINVHNFKSLKKISKKTGCKYKIIEKIGLPFFIFHNRKRTILCLSIFIFVFILYFFSSFVWSIKITGVHHINNHDILRFCEENNLYLGAYIDKIDTKQLQTDIKNNFDGISWVSVQVKGTLATIKVSESIPKEIAETSLENCSIVSDFDGIIYEIVTRNGTPLVKKNDEIKKGDILVSGELLLLDGEEIKGSYGTHADASIRAIVSENFDIEVPYTYYTKNYTGETKTYYSLNLFNSGFSSENLDIPFSEYDEVISITQLKIAENYPLPIIFKRNIYREYTQLQKTYSQSEAIIYANMLISERITSTVDFEDDILDKTVTYEEFEDKLIAKVELTLIKEIGEYSEIENTEKNIEDYEDYENYEND